MDDEIKLRFKLDRDTLTLNQLIEMQEGNLRVIRDVLASSLINDDDEYVEFEAAKKIIGTLSLNQLNDTAERFAQQVTVNPRIGGL